MVAPEIDKQVTERSPIGTGIATAAGEPGDVVDVVDAHVALTAIRRQGVILTSDPDAIGRLVAHADRPPRVVAT